METLIESLLISLALGAFLGLQLRKRAEEGGYHHKVFAGMRTCMAITLLGYLAVLLSNFRDDIFILFTGFFLILVLLSYAHSAFKKNRIGGTTETLLVSLYLVGALVAYGEINLAMIVTIILSIIASGYDYLYNFSDRFSRLEVIEMVKFAILIFLILPLLPNHPIDPLGVVNPYNVWLMVILISGIGFVGYLASKFIGKERGILVSAFAGGLVSSIGVTITMAIENKKKPKLTTIYALAILIASTTMFARVMTQTTIINPGLFIDLIKPIGAMMATMLGYTGYKFWQSKKNKPVKVPKLKSQIKVESPLSIKPALKFSIFYVAILLLIKASELYLGNKGIYITTFVSSLADIDAISISLSQLSSAGEITQSIAVRAITMGVIVNTFIKILYIHMFGSRELTKRMLTVFFLTSIIGIGVSFTV